VEPSPEASADGGERRRERRGPREVGTEERRPHEGCMPEAMSRRPTAARVCLVQPSLTNVVDRRVLQSQAQLHNAVGTHLPEKYKVGIDAAAARTAMPSHSADVPCRRPPPKDDEALPPQPTSKDAFQGWEAVATVIGCRVHRETGYRSERPRFWSASRIRVQDSWEARHGGV